MVFQEQFNISWYAGFRLYYSYKQGRKRPIMKIADLAIVGDLYKVVPELIAQLKGQK